MFQIEAGYIFTTACFRCRQVAFLWDCGVHLLHKQKEAAKPHFMPRRIKKFFNFGKLYTKFSHLHHRSRLRTFQAEELVAISIFTRPGLEKPA